MYAIAPATTSNRITPFFEVSSKELELNSSKGESRRREVHSIESNSSDVNHNKFNGYFPSQTSQSSNNEIIQFMKSQIQEVREEFMGALKELIQITKMSQNNPNSEIVNGENESENCSTFYKTSGLALMSSIKNAEENLYKDINKSTDESKYKKRK